MIKEDEKIHGYLTQTPNQIEAINSLKKLEVNVLCFLKGIVDNTKITECDQRWLAIAKTQIQQGFMAAVRAVAKPCGD